MRPNDLSSFCSIPLSKCSWPYQHFFLVWRSIAYCRCTRPQVVIPNLNAHLRGPIPFQSAQQGNHSFPSQLCKSYWCISQQERVLEMQNLLGSFLLPYCKSVPSPGPGRPGMSSCGQHGAVLAQIGCHISRSVELSLTRLFVCEVAYYWARKVVPSLHEQLKLHPTVW